VANSEALDEEPSEALPQNEHGDGRKGRRSFLRMRRELTEEELGTSAVQKLLMDELERLESENGDLKIIHSKYYQRDKEAEVLAHKIKTNLSADIFFGGSLTAGSALIGWSGSVWATQPTGTIVFIVRTMLFGVGIAARVVLK
jgi:hypothetical protein